MSRKVRLELTEAEAVALLTMCTHAEAGDLGELMGDGRQVAAALRALEKVRAAASNPALHNQDYRSNGGMGNVVTKPLLLNLCCCGGASCHGYELAGFEVWGVDIDPQPNYVHPDRFIQADALDVVNDRNFMARFSAVHGSPPCQGYSPLNAYNKREYPRLIEPIRDALNTYDVPYVIENVPGAPLRNPITLCGYMFPGLLVERHRLFETGGGLRIRQPHHPAHTLRCTRNGYVPTPEAPLMSIHGGKHSRAWQRKACEAMATPWLIAPPDADFERLRLGIREVCEAIPPAYSRWLGDRLMDVAIERESLALAAA